MGIRLQALAIWCSQSLQLVYGKVCLERLGRWLGCGVIGTLISHLGNGVLLGKGRVLRVHAQYSLGSMMTQRSLSQTA